MREWLYTIWFFLVDRFRYYWWIRGWTKLGLVNTLLANVMDIVIVKITSHIHFSGSSDPLEPWQNRCWVLNITEANVGVLEMKLCDLRDEFRQDSIAVTKGITVFI